jgi:hypothetical protein
MKEYLEIFTKLPVDVKVLTCFVVLFFIWVFRDFFRKYGFDLILVAMNKKNIADVVVNPDMSLNIIQKIVYYFPCNCIVSDKKKLETQLKRYVNYHRAHGYPLTYMLADIEKVNRAFLEIITDHLCEQVVLNNIFMNLIFPNSDLLDCVRKKVEEKIKEKKSMSISILFDKHIQYQPTHSAKFKRSDLGIEMEAVNVAE